MLTIRKKGKGIGKRKLFYKLASYFMGVYSISATRLQEEINESIDSMNEWTLRILEKWDCVAYGRAS